MQNDSPREGIRSLVWRDGALWLLDQRRLPAEEHWLEIRTVAQTTQAIRDMSVRGAPAIGIAAAYGVVLSARQHQGKAARVFRLAVESDMTELAAARPTAVNLRWALDRMRKHLGPADEGPDPASLIEAALAIHREDVEQNLTMGSIGAGLIRPGSRVLTHCNTGSLATGGHGTALGVIRTAWHEGRLAGIWATETRPWMQGARLTAWELVRDGIPVTLIADSAAALLMKEGLDWVIVGADRIAANGDVANKIGTYSLAVLAQQHGARFMVVAPSGTVDMKTASGGDIPIEERDASELWAFEGGDGSRPKGVAVWNPVFDITPASLVTVLVTERGHIPNPDAEKMAEVFETAK